MRTYTRTLALALALFCAIPAAYAADWSAWDQAGKQAVAACEAGAPKSKGYMVWRANCLNTAVETYLMPRSRDGDLWRLFDAYRLAMAARADRGEISVEDEGLLLAQKLIEIKDISLNRHNQQAAQQAAIDTANRAAYLPLLQLGLDMMSGHR